MYAVMARGKGVPVHVNEYLRDWLAREWLAKGRTQQELADLAEVDKATVSDFKNSKCGAGVPARMRSVSIDAVGDPSRAWWVARIMSEADIHRTRKP